MLGGFKIDTYNQLIEWKEQYGDIRQVEVNGVEFFFRLITKKEFDLLTTLFDNGLIVNEKVAELCVLAPEVEGGFSEDIYAGFSDTLARAILEESLIKGKPDEPKNYIVNRVNIEYNKVTESFQKQMPALIATAFPAYTIDEIEDMTLTRQTEIYAQALWILNEIKPQSYGIEFKNDDE